MASCCGSRYANSGKDDGAFSQGESSLATLERLSLQITAAMAVGLLQICNTVWLKMLKVTTVLTFLTSVSP